MSTAEINVSLHRMQPVPVPQQDGSEKRTVVLVAGSPETESKLPVYQLAAAYLVSYARADADLTRQYDFDILQFSYGTTRDYDIDKCVEFILEQKPVMVGFSYYVFNAQLLLAIAERLKATDHNVLVLFGGPNVSGAEKSKFMTQHPWVDFVIAEEGEIAFRQLLHALADRAADPDDYGAVQNLVYRRHGELVTNPIGGRIDIDSIPSPFLNGIIPRVVEPDDAKPKILGIKDMVMIWETNRGCPHHCAFCYWGVGFDKLSKMTNDRLEQELDLFLSNGVRAIMSADGNFGILQRDQEIANTVCQLNAKYGRPLRVFYTSWTKALKQRHIDISAMFAENRIENILGISFQSLTPEALDVAKRKPLQLDKAREIVAAATKRNISVLTHLILGLPGESYQEFLIGLDKVIALGIPIIWLCPLQLLPGTEFYDKQEEFQLETLQDPSLPFGEKTVVSHPKMTRLDQQAMIRIALVHYMFYNFKTAHVVNYWLYLMHDVKPSVLYEAFIVYLAAAPFAHLSAEASALRQQIKAVIDKDAAAHGGLSLFMGIARALWEDWGVTENLYSDFYLRFLPAHLCGGSTRIEERLDELKAVLHFNLLIAPRHFQEPCTGSFEHDVGHFFHNLMRFWRVGDIPPPLLETRRIAYQFWSPEPGKPAINTATHWARFGERLIWRFEELPTSA